jgi:peptidoglycan/xylan/chitin deacetylase (PgdA/CDA1 family)
VQLQCSRNCANFVQVGGGARTGRRGGVGQEQNDDDGLHLMAASIRRQVKVAMGRMAGFTGAYERRFRSQMTIVAFHRVNDRLTGDPLTCSSAKFEAFCRFFREHFRVIPLAEQVAGCRAGSDMGGTLSITFDDGYLDNVQVAAPILRKLKLPATFFVTTGFVGSQVTPPWDRDLPLQPGWMSWDDVRALHAEGFDVGSHTDSHLDMGTADLERVRADLALSKQKLLDQLGASAVQLFAYPFGGPEHISRLALGLVHEAGFKCCVACHGGVNSATPDPFSLNRIAIGQWYTDPDVFGFELLTGPPVHTAADSRGGQMAYSSDLG